MKSLFSRFLESRPPKLSRAAQTMDHKRRKGPPRWFILGLIGGVSGMALVLLGAALQSKVLFWLGLALFNGTIVLLSAPSILIFLGMVSPWLTLKSIQLNNWLEFET